jgi:hypothetical protein
MADNEPVVHEQISFLEKAAVRLERELAAAPPADGKQRNALMFLIAEARTRLDRLKRERAL